MTSKVLAMFRRPVKRKFYDFWTSKRDLFGPQIGTFLEQNPHRKIIKIVCFTVSLEVLELSIQEHENSILSKIMTTRKGPKITETV